MAANLNSFNMFITWMRIKEKITAVWITRVRVATMWIPAMRIIYVALHWIWGDTIIIGDGLVILRNNCIDVG